MFNHKFQCFQLNYLSKLVGNVNTKSVPSFSDSPERTKPPASLSYSIVPYFKFVVLINHSSKSMSLAMPCLLR